MTEDEGDIVNFDDEGDIVNFDDEASTTRLRRQGFDDKAKPCQFRLPDETRSDLAVTGHRDCCDGCPG